MRLLPGVTKCSADMSGIVVAGGSVTAAPPAWGAAVVPAAPRVTVNVVALAVVATMISESIWIAKVPVAGNPAVETTVMVVAVAVTAAVSVVCGLLTSISFARALP